MSDADRSKPQALWIAMIVAAAVTLLQAFGIGEVLELPVRDAALRLVPSRPPASTVIVAIDEQSIGELGHWPWPRTTLARIVDRIADAGARGVVLDVLLPESAPGDDALARAMRRLPAIAVSVFGDGKWLLPAEPLRSAATAAHGNFERDHDGIVRRFASTKQSLDRSMTALSLQAASLVSRRPVPVGRSIAPMFRTHPNKIPIISAASLLRNGARLSGAIVFIGPTAQGLGDRFLTPVSRDPDPGVTIHAAATESLLRGETVHAIPPIAAGPIAGLAVGVLAYFGRSRKATLIAAALLALMIAAGGLATLGAGGTAIPFAIFLLSILIATTAIEGRRMSAKATRLEDLATRLAEHRAREVESKRLLVHELKTPLASMRNLTQLLTGFELTEAERRRVTTLVESEAGKLQSMVHGLLDLERLPLRDFETASSVVDLGDLIVSRTQFLQASTDRVLTATVEPGLLVNADAALIERIIDNVVTNAMKYTPERSPVLVSARRSGVEVLIEVRDRGAGIPPSDRSRIFDRFFRGATAAGTEGLGLGLAFVAEVARWHGGTVSVESTPGEGSLFRVALPGAGTVARAGGM